MTDEIKMCKNLKDGHYVRYDLWELLDPQPSCRTCASLERCKILDDISWDVGLDEFFCNCWKVKE